MEPSAIRDRLVPALIFVVAISTYLAFPNVHFTFDSVAGGILFYQWKVLGKFDALLGAYHILFLPTIALVDTVAARSFGDLDPLALTQVVNAVFAAASLGLFFRVARLVGLDAAGALIATILLGGGFAWCFYATNGESYPISIFFLLLTVRSVILGSRDGSWKHAIAAGVWCAMAVAEHGSCLVAIPGFAIWLLGSRRDRQGARRVAAFMLATVLGVAVPYVARYALESRSGKPGFVSATTAQFAQEEGWERRPRVFGEWRGLIDAAVPKDWPGLPTSVPIVVGITNVLLSVASLLPLLLLAGVPPEDRVAVWGLSIWLLCTFLFFSLYFPGSHKFTQYSWVPLILLMLLATGSARLPALGRRAAMIALGTTAVLMCLSSADRIRIWGDEARNPYLSRARAVASVSEAQDLVIHLGTGPDQYQTVYVPYFSRRRVLALKPFFVRESKTDPSSFDRLAAGIASQAASARRVILLSSVFERNADARAFEERAGIPEGSLHAFFASYDPTSCGEDPNGGHLWCFEPRHPVR